jgi:hypothetical protein
MSAIEDLVKAINAFVGAKKVILGADAAYTWGSGYSQFERRAIFPIGIEGESPEQARLEVVGFPQSQEVKFRLSLCWNAAICRLDFTDETHTNTLRQHGDNIPYSVTGPHYHSWPLNKRFFQGAVSVVKLHNAEPFTMRANFDSVLRWFCHDVNIDQPSGRHMIGLPPRDRLL